VTPAGSLSVRLRVPLAVGRRRWRIALLLTADGRYADAAGLYTEMGSHPLAADQAAGQGRIADVTHQARAVLAFVGETGAGHHRQAEEFTNAASAQAGRKLAGT
jgi:hypothetical protein